MRGRAYHINRTLRVNSLIPELDTDPTMPTRNTKMSRGHFSFSRSTSSKGSASSEEESFDLDFVKIGRGSLRYGRGILSKHASRSMSRSDINMRVLVLGAANVGKTSMIKNLMGCKFSSKHKKTLQETYETKVEFEDIQIDLKIEDTGSSFIYDFPAMAEVSLQNCEGVVLVFSVEDPRSFEEVSKLRDFVFSKNPSMAMAVVGNKTDLERKLPALEIEATVCLDWDSGYVECSAWKQEGVKEVFRELAIQANLIEKDSLVLTDNIGKRSTFINTIFKKDCKRGFAKK